MPLIIPFPLGGMATELGMTADQLLDLDGARRRRCPGNDRLHESHLQGRSYVYYAGWPSLTVALAPASVL